MKIKFYGDTIEYLRFKLSGAFDIIDAIIAFMEGIVLSPMALRKGK